MGGSLYAWNDGEHGMVRGCFGGWELGCEPNDGWSMDDEEIRLLANTNKWMGNLLDFCTLLDK
jgi:hypothetical protein